MSIQGKSTEHRIYTAEEIGACLHFVKLPTPNTHSSSAISSSSNVAHIVEWWPCLVFESMFELCAVTKQLDMWSTLPMSQVMTNYIQQLPEAASCRVALLMGIPPSKNSIIQYDITRSETCTSLVVEPFYQKVVDCGKLYSNNEQYLNALRKTLPLLQEMTESIGRSCTNENSILVNSTNEMASEPAASNKVNGILTESYDTSSVNASNFSRSKQKKKMGETLKADNTAVQRCSPRISSAERTSTSSNEERKNQKVSIVTKKPNEESEKQEVSLATKTLLSKTSKPPAAGTIHKSTIPNTNVEFVEIPTFADVRKTLIKGGYSFQKKFFCRPLIVNDGETTIPPQMFTTIRDFRHDLCVYGVNCRCGISMDEEKACQCWDKDEKWTIKLWVRYDVIRGPIHVSSPVQVIPSIYKATQYLIRLGYNRRRLESPLTTEEQRHELFRYLSQYGLPTENSEKPSLCCDYTKISLEERFSLEYFISTNHFRVNTLYV
jgi:hypothetical protein